MKLEYDICNECERNGIDCLDNEKLVNMSYCPYYKNQNTANIYFTPKQKRKK